MQKEEVFLTDYDDIDKLVHTHTGHKEFSFCKEYEVRNDSWKQVLLDGYIDEDKWNEYKSGGNPEYFRAYDILNGLVKDGILQPGTYFVKISW